MLRGQVRLGRIFGIEIGLHFSWFIIAALLTMSLAGHLYSVNREWPTGLVWTAAGVAALAFFAAIPAPRAVPCGGRASERRGSPLDHAVRAGRDRAYEARHG